MKSYWVVSPNVKNKNSTVSDWRQTSVLNQAAFMGWRPDHPNHPIGGSFAYKIKPEDVILIARRHDNNPEIVGLGVVWGKNKRTIKGVKTPDKFGSMWKLVPFIPVSEKPAHIPLMDVLGYTRALVKLHPDRPDARGKAHARVCKWMEGVLSKNRNSGKKARIKTKTEEQVGPGETLIAAPPKNYQLDYSVRSKRQVIRAKKKEALLLKHYRLWLEQQGRKLATAKCGKLQCDGFEKKRQNLIEAKSSISRERIRMAVGQLLDYSFQFQKKFGTLNMGILLPKEPDPNSVGWLQPLNISLIWRVKEAFLDNANGKFT